MKTPQTRSFEVTPPALHAGCVMAMTLLVPAGVGVAIRFGKGETFISPLSTATVEQIAGIVKRFSGTIIEAQGHTDSEGDPGRNLTLSEQRAQAVADALVALGVPADEVTSRGFGETQLILDNNGVELPEQSRRVVFGVTANS